MKATKSQSFDLNTWKRVSELLKAPQSLAGIESICLPAGCSIAKVSGRRRSRESNWSVRACGGFLPYFHPFFLFDEIPGTNTMSCSIILAAVRLKRDETSLVPLHA